MEQRPAYLRGGRGRGFASREEPMVGKGRGTPHLPNGIDHINPSISLKYGSTSSIKNDVQGTSKSVGPVKNVNISNNNSNLNSSENAVAKCNQVVKVIEQVSGTPKGALKHHKNSGEEIFWAAAATHQEAAKRQLSSTDDLLLSDDDDDEDEEFHQKKAAVLSNLLKRLNNSACDSNHYYINAIILIGYGNNNYFSPGYALSAIQRMSRDLFYCYSLHFFQFLQVRVILEGQPCISRKLWKPGLTSASFA